MVLGCPLVDGVLPVVQSVSAVVRTSHARRTYGVSFGNGVRSVLARRCTKGCPAGVRRVSGDGVRRVRPVRTVFGLSVRIGSMSLDVARRRSCSVA